MCRTKRGNEASNAAELWPLAVKREGIMKRIATVIAIAGLILVTTSTVNAQGVEWEKLNQEVMDLYRAGKYDRAVVVAKKALEVAEKNAGPDHPNVAAVQENMAVLYRKMGRDKEAELLEKQAARIRAIRR